MQQQSLKKFNFIFAVIFKMEVFILHALSYKNTCGLSLVVFSAFCKVAHGRGMGYKVMVFG